MFVQVPDDFADELRRQISSQEDQEKLPASDLHRHVFQIAERDWRDYICYLDAELATLVRHSHVLHSFRILIDIIGCRKKKRFLSTSTSTANPTT